MKTYNFYPWYIKALLWFKPMCISMDTETRGLDGLSDVTHYEIYKELFGRTYVLATGKFNDQVLKNNQFFKVNVNESY